MIDSKEELVKRKDFINGYDEDLDGEFSFHSKKKNKNYIVEYYVPESFSDPLFFGEIGWNKLKCYDKVKDAEASIAKIKSNKYRMEQPFKMRIIDKNGKVIKEIE